MNYSPHLIGVSDYVANNIANRLLDDVRAKDRKVENQEVSASIAGSMRNPISQQRSHRRIVRSFGPLVVDHHLVTGHRFQSAIVNIADAKGWVIEPNHRGVGIRIDVIGCGGRGQRLRAFSTKAAVIDWHILKRMIQHAGLTDYDALLLLIKAWSNAMISDDIEFALIADWLHEGDRRVLVPIRIRDKPCAILTGSNAGIGLKHAVLRGITLFTHDMLTTDECSTIERLLDNPTTRFDLIKALPQRNGHLTD